jgi:hypothetical protein
LFVGKVATVFNTQGIIVWYTTQPIGEKMLNDMMKNVSKDAGLSKIYTKIAFLCDFLWFHSQPFPQI